MGCGCLLAPLKVVGSILRWCFTSGLKGFIVLGLVVLLGLVGYCQVNRALDGDKLPAETTVTTPSIAEAPYVVTTSSRYYYAAQVEQKDGITTITRYWELWGGKWVKNPGTLTMGKEFGTVTVGKR